MSKLSKEVTTRSLSLDIDGLRSLVNLIEEELPQPKKQPRQWWAIRPHRIVGSCETFQFNVSGEIAPERLPVDIREIELTGSDDEKRLTVTIRPRRQSFASPYYGSVFSEACARSEGEDENWVHGVAEKIRRQFERSAGMNWFLYTRWADWLGGALLVALGALLWLRVLHLLAGALAAILHMNAGQSADVKAALLANVPWLSLMTAWVGLGFARWAYPDIEVLPPPSGVRRLVRAILLAIVSGLLVNALLAFIR